MIHTTISQDEIDNLKNTLDSWAYRRPGYEAALVTIQKLQDQLTAVEEFNRQAAESNAIYDAQYEENDLPW